MIIANIQEKGKRAEIRRFKKSICRIGSGAENDIVINYRSVSDRHAEIHKLQDALYVIDIKSKKGTLVDSKKIPALQRIRVNPESVIQIGSKLLTVAFVSEKSGDDRNDLDEIGFTAQKNIEIIELKARIHNQLLDLIELRQLDYRRTGHVELREKCDHIVRQIIGERKHQVLEEFDQEELIKDILDEALALGPLEELLDDPTISEIMVNGSDKIYIEQHGRIKLSQKYFSDTRSVDRIIARIVAPLGRVVNESSPMVDARLKDGSRVNVVIPPLSLDGSCITIRKFSKEPIRAKDMVAYQTMTQSMVDFIQTCITHNKNILISGGTGSGKTTTLNVFSSFIPSDERIITIEDAAELQLTQPHVIRLESRPPNVEGKGEITIRMLMKNALRMRPDRIIIGECRGGEAIDMLQAMNTGHDGSLTTAHANSPVDVISRLETMVLQSGTDLPSRAIREQIASAVDLVVQQTRFSCGTRIITNISEVVGIEDNEIFLQDIFYFKQTGKDQSGKVVGSFMATGWIPTFYEDFRKRGIDLDMRIFHN